MSVIAKTLSRNLYKEFPLVFNRSGIQQMKVRKISSLLYNENNTKIQKCFSSQTELNELPPPAKFIKLSEGTMEDFKAAQEHFSRVASIENTVDRWINMIEALDGVNIGNLIDLKEHGLQSATRALKDGADEETVICALFHDVGEVITPSCHGEIAASMLRPYISEKNYWILAHHEIFQAYYYGDAMNVNKNIRDRFQNNEYFKPCETFCERWDETAFDPNYENLPISEFRPMLEKILQRKPYEVAENKIDCALVAAKEELSRAYNFEDWKKENS